MYCILSNSLSPAQLGLQWGGTREVSGGNELLCVLTVGNYIHVLSHIQPRPSQRASAVLGALRTAWGGVHGEADGARGEGRQNLEGLDVVGSGVWKSPVGREHALVRIYYV